MASKNYGVLDWNDCIYFYDLFIPWGSNNCKDVNLHSALRSDYFGASAYVGTIYSVTGAGV